MLLAADSPPIEALEFGHCDFTIPGTEQCIWVFQGHKRDFASGLLFWVKCLQAEGWESEQQSLIQHVQRASCSPVTKEEFCRLVTHWSRELLKPLPGYLSQPDGFGSGLQINMPVGGGCDEIGAVAELAESFVAFHWSSSA
jgi:hypothetical protein